MKAKELIPVKKELVFITRIALTIIASAVVSLAILYLFLSKPLDISYKSAFQLMAAVYREMNVYIITAVLVQLIFSSIIVYFIALLYSHKIAGPIFRLKAVLQQYMEGEEIEKVSFRRTDFIPGVSRIFTNFFTFLGNRKKLLVEGEALAAKLKEAGGPEKEAVRLRLRAIVRELEG
jgi:hypothetical protein